MIMQQITPNINMRRASIIKLYVKGKFLNLGSFSFPVDWGFNRTSVSDWIAFFSFSDLPSLGLYDKIASRERLGISNSLFIVFKPNLLPTISRMLLLGSSFIAASISSSIFVVFNWNSFFSINNGITSSKIAESYDLLVFFRNSTM